MKSEYDAMMQRYSCRAFQKELLPDDLRAELSDCVRSLNAASGLRFQIFFSDSVADPAVKLSSGMFSGDAFACAALVGPDTLSESERVGYYGEALVIFAEQRGLSTCWVASTYDKDSISIDVQPGERVWVVIPIGRAEKQPMKQRMIRSTIRKKDRPLQSFVESEAPFLALPSWVQKGAEAILAGPSAVNQQPVTLVWLDDALTMKIVKHGHGLEYCDMGIAKKQFEVSAAASLQPGKWAFGDGAGFTLD